MAKSKIVLYLLIVIISAIVYAITLCPTVEYIDSGELAMACKNLGIAHPTGYPLYTLLGHIVSILPFATLIIRLGWMSLIFTSLAVGILYLILNEILAKFELSKAYKNYIAAAVSLFMAFTPIWWSQGITNEVYALNLLLITTSIFFLLRYLNDNGKNSRLLLISFFIFGLSLTNHLSAIYLLPAFMVIILLDKKKNRPNRKLILWSIAFFALPLTLYLFLPIRALYKPFLNWGNVSDLYFLFKHVSGWQYRVWMFTDFGQLSLRLENAGRLFFHQFGWVGIVFIIIGIISVLIKSWKLTIFLLTIIVMNLIYAVNYEIIDIDSYYLPLYIAFSIFMVMGIAIILQYAEKFFKNFRHIKNIFILAIFILPLFNLVDNYYESDRSHKTFARQGAIDLVNSMEPNGLALVENWDFYSPWLYLHFEEKISPGIVFLDKELMRRSWYIDFIRRTHPDIYARSRIGIEEFLRRVEPFERGRRFDPQVIDNAYYEMFKAIIEHEMAVRPVYTNAYSDNKFLSLQSFVPDGLLLRFINTDLYFNRPQMIFDEYYWGDKSIYKEPRVGTVLDYYRRAFDTRENYCRYYKNTVEADYYGLLSKKVDSIIREISNK